MTNIIATQTIEIISCTNKEFEAWKKTWERRGKLLMLSKNLSHEHAYQKLMREAHNNEIFLKIDCWYKIHTLFPNISKDSFNQIFAVLMQSFYKELKYNFKPK